ncbi:uncharacterized protein [Nicotiana sylvestris]|uniref:uncharacterized protein n=1 Tax=Nicotiana sylvestris TaxID=4096 RepID=UPI00388CDC33
MAIQYCMGSESNVNEQFKNDQAIDEALKKLIAQQVGNALRAFVNQLSVVPPMPTPNNNTMENPRSGLVNSGIGGTPSESRDGGSETAQGTERPHRANTWSAAYSFIKAHSGAQKVEKIMEDIFKTKQGDSELLREFVGRFQRERMMLPRVPNNWAAMAFASNFNEKSSEAMRRLKKSLREFPATTWNDVYNRYEPYMGPAGRDSRSKQDNSRYDHRSRDRESGSLSRFGKERNARDKRDDDRSLGKFGGYNLNVSTSELVAVLRSMGDKQGYLTELFSEKAKKISKVTVTHEKRVRHALEEESITFDDADANGVLTPHNDTLVISLLVHDTNVKRVLIDPGSFVRVLNEMQAEEKLVPKVHTLSGFDNLSIITKGEVVLTTFAEGVVKDTNFQVVEMDMAYNMILGRPWIHETDVVPSTLHQVIKFPSQWGIRQIRGDQQTSRSINSVADSSTKNEEK